MISYIYLKNFKSFSEIFFDLRDSHKIPKKTVFIYGENGAGKSNLISSILFLIETLYTLKNNKIRENNINNIHLSDELISNLSEFLKNNANLFSIIKKKNDLSSFSSSYLSSIISKYKMIDSNEQSLIVEIGFRINDSNGYYRLECSENEIINETLNYKINKINGIIFSIEKNKINLSKTIFENEYKKELISNIKKYWGKHSFISILFNELEEKNKSYIEDNINVNLLSVLTWLEKLSICYKDNEFETTKIIIPKELKLLPSLDYGFVYKNNTTILDKTENILNILFTSIYSDVEEVYYNRREEINGRLVYELYFKKLIDNKILDIPFYLESSGTKKLLNLFPLLIASVDNVACIDEIDSGIHDILIKKLLDGLSDVIKGQLIITTHNTLLLEVLKPKYTYIINIDARANKSIDCINDFPKRTQKTNNIRDKYLRGDYGGVPNVGFVDFNEIINSN